MATPQSSGDKLYFYSTSADAKPGKGVKETVADPALYTQLAGMKDWRRTLSNFHVCPFKYKQKTYRTIEHAFQAEKIRIADPVVAERFTVESGDPIGQGDGNVARKNRKIVILTPAQLTVWQDQAARVLERAARAKYSQCAESVAVLLATQQAQLWHIVQRSANPVRFMHLETIRRELRETVCLPETTNERASLQAGSASSSARQNYTMGGVKGKGKERLESSPPPRRVQSVSSVAKQQAAPIPVPTRPVEAAPPARRQRAPKPKAAAPAPGVEQEAEGDDMLRPVEAAPPTRRKRAPKPKAAAPAPGVEQEADVLDTETVAMTSPVVFPPLLFTPSNAPLSQSRQTSPSE
jgi:predicted NAD-dependent protein-ADP-ribosyltransferase YbiA (DUF1768 family)